MSTTTDDFEQTDPPEDLPAFRLAQLLLVLQAIGKPSTIERVAYADFFASNPMLIPDLKDADRTELVLAGFDSRTIDSFSAAQRFATRRERARADVATLMTYGLSQLESTNGSIKYSLTDRGVRSSSELSAKYADSLRTSTALVIPLLNRLSDARLRSSAQAWLDTDQRTLDLMGLDLRPGRQTA